MEAQQAAGGDAPVEPASETLTLRRLLPPGTPVSPADLVEETGLWERSASPPPRPRVVLNMVSTADGHATIAGRSGPISSSADRELFHALRAPVDAILVGAGTIRTERYGPLVRAADVRELRRRHGLAAQPLACVVSASLRIDPAIPLVADPETHLVVLTPASGELGDVVAHVDYVRCERNGQLDLEAALGHLSERFGVQQVLCEGGPHLAGELLAAGLLDELFLSVSPKLAGGDPPGAPALRIVAGTPLDPTVELTLVGALESDSHLFLRYRVVAPERVSCETMLSSSLAS